MVLAIFRNTNLDITLLTHWIRYVLVLCKLNIHFIFSTLPKLYYFTNTPYDWINLPKQVLIGSDVVVVASSVQLLGIHIDDQFSFNLHISNICKYASTRFNALVRLKFFLGFDERKVLINSFILSNFSYCPFYGLYHQLSL